MVILSYTDKLEMPHLDHGDCAYIYRRSKNSVKNCQSETGRAHSGLKVQ